MDLTVDVLCVQEMKWKESKAPSFGAGFKSVSDRDMSEGLMLNVCGSDPQVGYEVVKSVLRLGFIKTEVFQQEEE